MNSTLSGPALGALVVSVLAIPRAYGQGHGPIYGLSTPTLGRGGWSVDIAAMLRRTAGDEPESSVMLRPMLSYGITEDVQVSISGPIPISTADGARTVRGFSRMPAARDIEALLGWRFHRQATGVGSRFESTAYAGVDIPTDDVRGGTDTAPGLVGALVTGYASRSVYAWAGGAYARSLEDAEPDAGAWQTILYSLVLGYRPAMFRKDLPHPDWRVFIEAIGEYTRPGLGVESGAAATRGHEIFVGPTLLGLFGAWGISGGPVFRVYEDLEGAAPGDRLRIAINTTIWF